MNSPIKMNYVGMFCLVAHLYFLLNNQLPIATYWLVWAVLVRPKQGPSNNDKPSL